jgi:hypothetical protein
MLSVSYFSSLRITYGEMKSTATLRSFAELGMTGQLFLLNSSARKFPSVQVAIAPCGQSWGCCDF